MSKPSPPDPPDPQETSAAQTGTNVSSTIANNMMGMISQNTPTGSQSFDQTGSYTMTDPYTGQSYEIPTFTSTTTLSPEAQAAHDASVQAQGNLSQLAADQSGFLQDYMGQGFDPSSLPEVRDLPASGPELQSYQSDAGLTNQAAEGGAINRNIAGAGPISTGFGDVGNVDRGFANTGPVSTSFGGAGPLTRSYGGDFSDERNQVEDALFARMQPHFDRDRNALRSRLANQGITEGSEAYRNSLADFDQNMNDARYGAILNAAQEQSRLTAMERDRAAFENTAQGQAFGQALGRGQFANAAQNQAYGQALGRGQFANSAQNQAYGQALGRGQFANSAQGQQFDQNAQNAAFGNAAQAQAFGQDAANLDRFNATQQQQFANQNAATSANNQNANTAYNQQMQLYNASQQARNQALQEEFAMRNQPINEITALLSGGQVSMPNFGLPGMSNIPITDNAGLINDHYNQQLQNWQINNAQQQSLYGGLLGGLGSLMMGF